MFCSLALAHSICGVMKDEECFKKTGTRLIFLDLAVFITALVIGILGLTSTISMPTAAAYGIIAVPSAMAVPALICLVIIGIAKCVGNTRHSTT